MQECWDPIMSVVIPLTVMNVIGTTLVILISRCAERTFCNNREKLTEDVMEISSDDNMGEFGSGRDVAESNSEREVTMSDRDSTRSSSENEAESLSERDVVDEHGNNTSNKITDEDLIAHVRESSVLSMIDNDVSPRTERNEKGNSKAANARNEIMGDQASLESMASSLISFSKNIAGTLDNSTLIPQDKKSELAGLLKGMPGLITKIVDMDDDELSEMLHCKIAPKNKDNSAENRKKESEFLMKTLESLK